MIAWSNFGSNVSWGQTPTGRPRLRLDTTGEVIIPAGPAGRDAILGALYDSRDNEGYAYYNFGEAFIPVMPDLTTTGLFFNRRSTSSV